MIWPLPPRQARPRRRRVLAFIDLVQDIEVLLPLLARLQADGEVELDIVVSRWLQRESPRTERLLRGQQLPFRWVARRDVIEGRAPPLRGRRVLLTASESSHPAHLAGFRLAQRARDAGLMTCTLQHGLENVGLLGDPDARFASEVVFTWHPPALTAHLAPETQAKLHHVGRPAAPPPRGVPVTHAVGVFENLHSDRYSDGDRNAFMAGLAALAKSGASVLLRPHPAGRWSANAAVLPAGVGRAEDDTALATLARVRRVITTPSTIVLEAALMRRPLALAASGSPLFSQFPVLVEPSDWAAFAGAAADQSAVAEPFVQRVLLPGDAAERMASVITHATVRKRL